VNIDMPCLVYDFSNLFRYQRQGLIRFTVTVIGILVLSVSTFALRQERLIDTWRPTHYDVALTLNDQLTEIAAARADIEIVAVKNLSLIDLDFGDLTTDSVNVNSNPVSFVQRNGKLEVKLSEAIAAGTKLIVSVVYHGKPKDGLILTTDKDGKPSAVGDNWPDRVHHWIPCFDHPSAKATVTFKITAPSNDVVVANGRLSGVETNSTSTKTWTYTEGIPIPPYCMIIGVGDFVKLEPTQSAPTPLSYYVAHSDSAYATKGFAPASPALQLFSQTVDAYPYEKLALIIGATRFGGMENSSAIVFTPTLFRIAPEARLSTAFGIPNGIEDVVAHEIAHQWFGDSVTEATWADLWLSEGFATYFAGLFIEKYEGQKAFEAYMNNAAETAFKYEQKRQTPINDRETEKLFDLLNANNYQKGAWVLHMLRSRLGDEVFFRGIRAYYQKHKNSIATTEDLREALEEVSSKPLRSFFSRWVYESGHPQYEVSWSWSSKKKQLRLELRQKQNGNIFLDDVPVIVSTAKGERRFLVRPKIRNTVEVTNVEVLPQTIRIDPDNTLLKEVLSVRRTGL
jgi:aminopeptidase N